MRTGSVACRAIAAQAHASESLPPHPLPAKARKAKPLKRTAARRPLSSSPSRFLHNQLSKRAEGKNPSGPEGASSKPKATKRTSYFICPSSSSDSHETFSSCGFNFLEPCAHVEKFSFLPSLCALSTVQTQVTLSNCLGWVPFAATTVRNPSLLGAQHHKAPASPSLRIGPLHCFPKQRHWHPVWRIPGRIWACRPTPNGLEQVLL